MIKRIIIILCLSIFFIGCGDKGNSSTSEDIALLRAIKNNDLETVELIYGSKGYEKNKLVIINNLSGVDNTPLMYAAFNGSNEIVNYMLTYKIDINKKNISGDTALMLAAMRGNNNNIKSLIEAGADVNVKNTKNNTALIYASAMGYPQTVRLLIEYGADANIKSDQLNGTAEEIAVDVASEMDDSKKKMKYMDIYRYLKHINIKK